MTRQYEGHSQTYAQQSRSQKTGHASSKKNKKQKVMSAGFLSVVLLLGIITFAVCFVVGIAIGPSLPI